VDEKDLTSANSRHQFVNGFSTIAGAFLGGISISAFGYLWVFIVNAVSFVLSAGFECFIHISHTPGHAHKEERPSILKDMKQGYQYIFSRRPLVILLLMAMIIHFFVGSIEVFMPVIANTISEDGARNRI
jgi:DHA3 family macrolide efflux protein-like MFS transporter